MFSINTFKRICFFAAISFCLESGAQQPGEVSIGSNAITYYAQQGDTLISIANKYTEKSSNWISIGKLNKIANDRAIPIRTGITIPFNLLRELPIQAKVIAYAGQSTVGLDPTSAQAVAVGTVVREGTIITTSKNGFVTLELPDNSRISIPSNSQIKLSKLRATQYANSPKTELTLLAGRVESTVSSLKTNNGRFEVHSPLAIAGVRGTHFRVDVSDAHAANEVLEGNVAVGQTAHPNALSLAAGKGNIIDAKSVGASVDLLAAPKLVGNFALQERILVKFDAENNALAKSYRAQIALDDKAQNLIQENLFAEPHFKFSNLDDGNYFLRVTAIDANGLEGLPSVVPFKLKAHPEPPFNIAPKKKLRAQQVDFSWSEAANATGYHLQVASDEQFAHLLIDQATLSDHQFTTTELPVGTFFWRVATIATKNETQDHGPFGDVDKVQLLAPAAGLPPVTDQGGSEISFSWASEPGQTFVLQMSDDTDFKHILINQKLAAPEYQLARPSAGTYYLRVQAIDADGYVGAFSGTQKFTVFSRLMSTDGTPVNSAAGVVRTNF